MADNNWYGARTLYEVYPNKQMETKIYEERVVLLLSSSFDEAIAKAENEAEKYADKTDMKYLGFVNVYQVYDETVGDGSEVYSLMRESELSPEKYIDTFFDTGREKTR